MSFEKAPSICWLKKTSKSRESATTAMNNMKPRTKSFLFVLFDRLLGVAAIEIYYSVDVGIKYVRLLVDDVGIDQAYEVWQAVDVLDENAYAVETLLYGYRTSYIA